MHRKAQLNKIAEMSSNAEAKRKLQEYATNYDNFKAQHKDIVTIFEEGQIKTSFAEFLLIVARIEVPIIIIQISQDIMQFVHQV